MSSKPLSIQANIRKAVLIGALLAPALILFNVFVVIPVFQAGFYSLFKWNGIGPLQDFILFDNFKKILNDRIFHIALKNNFKVILISLLIQLPLAFCVALLLGRNKFRGEAFLRSIFFFPYILAEIVSGIIWKFIYNPQFGVPTIFSRYFLDGHEIGLMGDPEKAFSAILVVIIWKYLGFHMILYIAGLQGVPTSLEEAATIDGANRLQVVRHVIIPCMKNTFVISIFLSIIGAFNIFDVVWALGQGGPVHSSETLVTYLYNFGFKRMSFGYGSAVAVTLFCFCFVFNLVYQRMVRED
ncbi:carbohydrate ABC transporter permease [Oceanispirochaeta sp.]|jgi:raffinose/stachyose/melibiose transport system permease protein|uniref:carbohydrate ABC transporter permease n=1 Tax=Oceanispirochaeta sp. TaxID=2035350 RepID=UPI00263181D5|nr:sugar ABC transporter permease [Oceanispirochaeta sp.]MDA3956271.1 sugar ABC transporter permease [Oceanispirochaeta sp.]